MSEHINTTSSKQKSKCFTPIIRQEIKNGDGVFVGDFFTDFLGHKGVIVAVTKNRNPNNTIFYVCPEGIDRKRCCCCSFNEECQLG